MLIPVVQWHLCGGASDDGDVLQIICIGYHIKIRWKIINKVYRLPASFVSAHAGNYAVVIPDMMATSC